MNQPVKVFPKRLEGRVVFERVLSEALKFQRLVESYRQRRPRDCEDEVTKNVFDALDDLEPMLAEVQGHLAEGHGGEDVLYGGTGSARLVGGPGSNVLYGNAGDEELWAHARQALNHRARSRSCPHGGSLDAAIAFSQIVAYLAHQLGHAAATMIPGHVRV